mmetsp:Transcript_4469/g.14531  ORF Transcript_4469/g.14531 Transcript_4469/m.14531 type:complete len:1006 (+) Transcript_4469:2267-5284(+)
MRVVLQPGGRAPFRLENRTTYPLEYRQGSLPGATTEYAWAPLPPCSTAGLVWVEPLRAGALGEQVEIRAVGEDPRRYQLGPAGARGGAGERGAAAAVALPLPGYPGEALVAVGEDSRGESSRVLTIAVPHRRRGLHAAHPRPRLARTPQGGTLVQGGAQSEWTMRVDVATMDISVVDHQPLELALVTAGGLKLLYGTGLGGGGFSSTEVSVRTLQVDDQLTFSQFPVVLAQRRHLKGRARRDQPLLRAVVTSRTAGAGPRGTGDATYYPVISAVVSDSMVLRLHEPLVWRCICMADRLPLGLLPTDPAPVKVDREMQLALVQVSGVRLDVGFRTAPSSRPKKLGAAMGIGFAFANLDEVAISLKPWSLENVLLRESRLVEILYVRVRKQLMQQVLNVITGVDVLGSASRGFGQMSAAVASLSSSRAPGSPAPGADHRVTSFGEGLVDGGEALAKGVFRGISGLFTKPVEGAQKKGLEGFMMGMGKGIVGVAAQPVSGVLDLVAKTTEGASASIDSVSAALSNQGEARRHRPPRAVSGDRVLRAYDEYEAAGQHILWMSVKGSYFGQGADIFKKRGKYATDAYESHQQLPGKLIVILTSRRVVLLKEPSSGRLMDDPCSSLWDVQWADLLTTELGYSKQAFADASRAAKEGDPPDVLVLHLRKADAGRLLENVAVERVLRCHGGTRQAEQLRAIVHALHERYGQGAGGSGGSPEKRKASEARALVGASAGGASGAALGLLTGPAAPVTVPVFTALGTMVGGLSGASSNALTGKRGQKRLMFRKLTRKMGKAVSTAVARTGGAGGAGRLPAGAALPPAPAARPPCGAGSSRLPSQAQSVGFNLIWTLHGKDELSIWRPIAPPGYASVGDVLVVGHDCPAPVSVYAEGAAAVLPARFTLIWRDTSGAQPVSIWAPAPPPPREGHAGYAAIGCVAVSGSDEPDPSCVRCIAKPSTFQVTLFDAPCYLGRAGDRSAWKVGLWQVDNDAGTFVARRDHTRPPDSWALAALL